MRHQRLIVCLAALLLSIAAQSEEQKHMRLEIAVDKNDRNSTSFDFDSGSAGIDLQQMQVGESHTITDSSGNAALVTRTTKGFQFDIDGETIDVPDPATVHAAHDIDVHVVEERDDTVGNVRVIRKVKKIGFVESDEDAIIVDDHSAQGDAALHGEKEHKVVIIKKEIDEPN